MDDEDNDEDDDHEYKHQYEHEADLEEAAVVIEQEAPDGKHEGAPEGDEEGVAEGDEEGAPEGETKTRLRAKKKECQAFRVASQLTKKIRMMQTSQMKKKGTIFCSKQAKPTSSKM